MTWDPERKITVPTKSPSRDSRGRIVYSHGSLELPLPARFTLLVGKHDTGIGWVLQSLRYRSDYAFHTKAYFGAELHPEEIYSAVEGERAALERDPPHVVNVFWTQHPYVVDRFKPTDVVAVAKCPDGIIRAKVLTEHPDYEKWQFGTQTGEFWAAVREKWVK